MKTFEMKTSPLLKKTPPPSKKMKRLISELETEISLNETLDSVYATDCVKRKLLYKRKKSSPIRPTFIAERDKSSFILDTLDINSKLRIFHHGKSYQEIFLQELVSGVTATVLIFFGLIEFPFLKFISDSYERLRREAGIEIYGISSDTTVNAYNFPILNELDGSLIKSFNAFHPLGGGKYPMDMLTILDSDGRNRVQVPIGFGNGAVKPLAPEKVDEFVIDCAQYLKEEYVLRSQ